MFCGFGVAMPSFLCVFADWHRRPAQPGEQMDHIPESPHGVLGSGGGRHRNALWWTWWGRTAVVCLPSSACFHRPSSGSLCFQQNAFYTNNPWNVLCLVWISVAGPSFFLQQSLLLLFIYEHIIISLVQCFGFALLFRSSGCICQHAHSCFLAPACRMRWFSCDWKVCGFVHVCVFSFRKCVFAGNRSTQGPVGVRSLHVHKVRSAQPTVTFLQAAAVMLITDWISAGGGVLRVTGLVTYRHHISFTISYCVLVASPYGLHFLSSSTQTDI